jgi:excisionase family DNA binding protein
MAVALLTTQQVQALLQVDRTTIYRMVESGRLPAVRVGKQWRFPQIEIERWLQAHAVAPGPVPRASGPPAPATAADSARSLRDVLPLTCCQLILDAFADALGAFLAVTDMAGAPQLDISHAGGAYAALARDPNALARLVPVWRALAESPVMEPRFVAADGFLFARGLIRVGPALRGTVVIGHIDPAPGDGRTARLAEATGLAPGWVARHAEVAADVDRVDQARALAAVQRIADIFSHIAEDRQALCGRLEAIASLTSLSFDSPTEGMAR